jgi:hypothetical protein
MILIGDVALTLRHSGMVREHQTSNVQLHIGESRDSGFDASHRPGMTAWEEKQKPGRSSGRVQNQGAADLPPVRSDQLQT